MDQRTGLAPSGTLTLTDALARLGAVDPVRRQLAPALTAQVVPAQPAQGAAYTLAAAAWVCSSAVSFRCPDITSPPRSVAMSSNCQLMP